MIITIIGNTTGTAREAVPFLFRAAGHPSHKEQNHERQHRA
jgi:hypothetical protein